MRHRLPLATLLFSLAAAVALHGADRAPFRVIYSDDTTHILSCPSPFKPEKSSMREKFIWAAVDEVADAGVDACMLQPGLGWVPWWKSEIVPIKEHLAFLEKMGQNMTSYDRFVLNGGDMVQSFLQQCAIRQKPGFISIRLNDVHHVWRALVNMGVEDREKAMAEFQFFADNPDARIGPGLKGDQRMQYAMDWGNPKVPEHKFRLIEELIKNYDLDGLELDFMRHVTRFNPTRTTKEQRAQIMTDFAARVRKALDENMRDGKRPWLCVRIPGYREEFDESGVDLKALCAAGVDMFNLSNYYFCDMQMEVPEIRAELPQDKAVYSEIHYVTANGITDPETQTGQWKRTEPAQMRTIAHMAYARGAQGVSFFNFPYYRGTHTGVDKLGAIAGGNAEPPWDAIKDLKNPEWLARQPQYYVVGREYNTPRLKHRPLRQKLVLNQPENVILDMAPPTGGWKKDGKLRIQALADMKDAQFTVHLNGTALPPNADISPVFPPRYHVAEGTPADYRAYNVPASLLKDEKNTFEIIQTTGDPVQLFFMDVSLP